MARALLAEFRKLLLSKRVFSCEGEKPDVGEGGGSDSSASQASSGSSGAAVSSGVTQGKSAGDAVPARVMAVALQVAMLAVRVLAMKREQYQFIIILVYYLAAYLLDC